MKLLKLLPITAFTLIVAGCSSKSPQELNNFPELSAQQLYQEAKTSLRNENFRSAAERLEALNARYPFGPFAQQSQLDLMFAYYKLNNKEKADAVAERFIRQNPNHVELDYAYYMKGLINFEQNPSFPANVITADVGKRDVSQLRQSFDNFSELLRRFPKSDYAADAQQRMIYIRNKLAEYELHVARYYMRRDTYLAAANRAQYIVEHFPNTESVPYALELMKRAYEILELPDLAENARRILLLNYPEFSAKHL
jgi:outer membrane protein assembly factor BamD